MLCYKLEWDKNACFTSCAIKLPDSAQDVVDMIEVLLSNHSTLNYDELTIVLNKLQDIINVSVVTPELGQALLNIISNILKSESNLVPFTNK